jgi:hypothetical protein
LSISEILHAVVAYPIPPSTFGLEKGNLKKDKAGDGLDYMTIVAALFLNETYLVIIQMLHRSFATKFILDNFLVTLMG